MEEQITEFFIKSLLLNNSARDFQTSTYLEKFWESSDKRSIFLGIFCYSRCCSIYKLYYTPVI